MVDRIIVKDLVRLIQLGMITVDDIKIPEYKTAVEQELAE